MSEWRPIESAPKNEPVSIWHRHYGEMTAWFDTGDEYIAPHWRAGPSRNGGSGFANWREDEWLEDEQDGVAYWKPLSEPPEAT